MSDESSQLTEVPAHPRTPATQRGGVDQAHIEDEAKSPVLDALFGALLFVAVLLFYFWARGQVGPGNHALLLIITIALGVFMAFNIGGNDVANSFGTSVGAGTLSLRQALMVAAVFEVGGAVLAGGEVTETVKSGIVDLNSVDLAPMDFAFIMMSALLGAALWLLVATRMGWPVSTTHSIVGAIVGGAITLGYLTDITGSASPWVMVQWGEIGKIVISWFLSPLLGGVVAYALYRVVKESILVYNDRAADKLEDLRSKRNDHRARFREEFNSLPEAEKISVNGAMARDAVTTTSKDFDLEDLESEYYRDLYRINAEANDVDAHRALIRFVPLVAAAGAGIITAMMLFKGLSNTGISLDSLGNVLVILMVSAAVWMAVYIFARSMRQLSLERSTFILFSWMQVFTASAFAFSHGSNDIANAVGPFAAVLDVLKENQIVEEAEVPMALMVTAGVGLVVGLWFIGRHVIATVGTKLTEMHPASGFSAELSAAAVVMSASLLGLPVSSTHILIGAVLGVGMVNRDANWGLMRQIGLAWVITVPVSAVIGAVGLVALRSIFG
ncbi:inorganic phosphate transporter [Corynebacterium liangguodongii]|uniref:Phosphate transporter n=1 Tax=Corynebacterium liangguodongii TaxID=2079535 RepID=A0A2S0WFQ3_9CORY|nr:inorganic phosphate transporter [Corynebacterium liangguodongii]AWB84580.1 phosphate permease [Corynebacterium liangguodongii]PWB98835.1 inorganic phosphate transporter [Corynebacterium liangguodongii]